MVKIRKDEKKGKGKEFVKAWRRKGNKRKIQWKKKEKKKRRENSEMNYLFLCYFFHPFLLLRVGMSRDIPRRQWKWDDYYPLVWINSSKPSENDRLERIWVTGETRCLYLVTSLGLPDTRREKPNDWLGPQNGSGDSFPSAEIENKKVSCWTGFVGDRTKSHVLRVKEDEEILRDTKKPFSSSQC